MTTKSPRYHFDLVCPRCDRQSETVTENREPPPHVNCGDCLMDDTEVVEFKIVRVSVIALALFAMLLFNSSSVWAQQRTVYGSDGRVQQRITTDSQGSQTIYGADGRVQGRTSTGSNGTTTVYGSDGRVQGTITAPSGGKR